jgi:Zn-dependent alcohol dehydrogenase
MKTKAAVIWNGTGGPFEITELDLDDPKEEEVLIRYEYAGMGTSRFRRRWSVVTRVPA